MAYEVFISYSSADLPVAEAIRQALRDRKITCWMAPWDIVPGEHYADSIMHGIRASRVMVVVVSSHCFESDHVFAELERGSHYKLVVVPFRIDATLLRGRWEYFLSTRHWLDASQPCWQPWLPSLADAVEAQLRWQRPLGPCQNAPAQNGQCEAPDDLLCQRTIVEIADRMVEQRQSTVSVADLDEERAAAIDELVDRGILHQQPSPVAPHPQCVRFRARETCRQALADWVESHLTNSGDDILQRATEFPLLADGLAEYVFRQWEAGGESLLIRWAHYDLASVERLVAATIQKLADGGEKFSRATSMLLEGGSASAVRGLALGAQQLMESRFFGPASQLFGQVAEWARRQPWSNEGQRFLLEIASEQGRLLRRAGRFDEARRHFQSLLHDAEHFGDQRLLGVVTNNYARLLLESSGEEADHATIIDMLQANVPRLQAFGDSNDLAVAYHNLGQALANRDAATAERYFKLDVAVSRRLNDGAALTDALDTLGLFLCDQRRWHEAEAVHREEIALLESRFDLPRQARALANLGRCLLCQATASTERDTPLTQARKACGQARLIYSSLDEPREFAPLLENLARICYLLGDLADFRRFATESLSQYGRWPEGQTIASQLQAELGHLLTAVSAGDNGQQASPL